MKRLCVFAHWDRDNIVDDYVVYYLKSLREVCSTIILVSDTEGTDVSNLEGIVDYSLVKKHGEYDFGSYKRGFLYALENNIEFDELIFANDSCYGPFYSLKPVFDKMAKKRCDWWGLTRNSYGIEKRNNENCSIWFPHIQSYFLVFSSKVFNSDAFKNFIKLIEKQDEKDFVIINYEMGLSKVLKDSGFKSAVLINKYLHTKNCLSAKWKRLIKWYKFPFVKTSVIKNGIFVLGRVYDWEETISSVSTYPVELIASNADRLKNYEMDLYKDFNLYRKIRFRILNNSPVEFRNIVIFFEKYLFRIANTICFNKLKKF